MSESKLVESAAVVTRMEAWWSEWLDAIGSLSDDELVQPGVCETWSVKDLMAHIAVWDEYAAGVLRKGSRDQNEGFDLNRFNAESVQRDAGRSLDQVREQMLARHAELRDLIASREPIDPGLVADDTYNHYPEHIDTVLEWRSQQAGVRDAGMTSEQIMDRIAASWAAWLAAIEGVPADLHDEPGICGDWSLNDLLTHVALWDEETTAYIERERDGTPHPVSRDWQALNSRDAAINRGRPTAERLDAMRSAHQRLLDTIAAGPAVVAQWVADSTYEHYPQHAAQVRAWKRWRVS